MSLHITKLTVRDLGNIEYYETKLGMVNVILGGNGTGKTNLVRVFRWIFNGGNDPELLRDGCDEGWAEFELSNGYKAHKHIWIKEDGDIGYELKVFTPEGAAAAGR